MNYALYLQNGGSAEPRQFSEEEIAMIKTLQPYGEAFKQSPGGAIEMAARELNFNLDNPAEIREFLTGLDAYARLIDDVDLINDIQKFGQESNLVAEEPMFKCGGRVRAKVKKACGGKKLEKGAKIPAEKKGGCPCQYKKIGGHIKLVDCNGIPVAKDGSILYAKPGDQLPPAKAAPFSDQWFGDLGHAFVRKMDAWQADLQRKNPSFWGNPTQQVTPVAEPAVGSEEWKAQQRAAQETYNQSPEGQTAIARANEAVAAKQTAAPAAAPKQTWRQMFDAGLVKYGGLTKEEALARQKEMQAAKGFNADLGKWGADGMWGNQSKAEWERYQAWKLDQERTANANLTRLESPVKGLTTTIITPNAMTASNPNSLTLDKNRNIANLNTLTPGQALQLDNAAWNRYLQYIRNRILSSKTGGKLNYAEYLK